MKLDMSGVIYSLSYALDCIEAEIVGVLADHAKWVAYIATLVGKEYGLSEDALSDLSACAALHDNALTQYLAEERDKNDTDFYGIHCKKGEENVREFPFYGDTEGFILYHHENADGSGPFKKQINEIPIQAHIIHLADILDVACQVQHVSEENYSRMQVFLKQQRGSMFSDEVVDQFFRALPLEEYLALAGKPVDDLLSKVLLHKIKEYSFTQVQTVVDVFGKIVDYKSTFTRNHSEQIAKKMMYMAKLYGYSEEKSQRLYVAAVLHDIGKMAIKNDVLEKPDKLTDTEFAYMQNHAWYTYRILKKIRGFEDITEWASFHHEKLNGKGYPFGKTGAELSQTDRLMCCIDIYQALSEERPYKKGLPHEKCMEIMRCMVDGGFIDGQITEDIGKAFGSPV